jgi:hypothetical protein
LDDKQAAEKMRLAAEGATPFETSAFFEKLIEVRLRRPKDYAILSPATKIALGYYERAKAGV